ncbi:MaoC/PaaZ C-terminal domain-containing protein [Natronomonas gomsonensis]|uniref:MaoC/PaaZ C-terminal domain-containing protein n=1 Tax=Natronomonas gomsonensis TaxID=1046043 RepID=UPI0015BD2DB2|nr:MaoC/PaaZ C-terminal domain-containing protein [Natronomonas gomsonensis]
MELKRYFDDFEIGDSSRSNGGRTVTETDIFRAVGYGAGERMHVDREHVETTEFDDLLVQNTVLIVISSALWGDVPGWDYETPVAYGRDGMRFVNPAYPGDTLHLEVEVVDKRIREKDREAGRRRGLITINEELRNQDGDLVMVNDHHSLVPFSPDFDPE